MARRDTGTDDPRVRVRASKSTRPRSKLRPTFENAPIGQVTAIDRGRYQVQVEGHDVQCIKARELGRGGVVMGDLARIDGDISGTPGSLARIVQIRPREHVLRRSLEDADGRAEKIIVANADLMVVVVAATNPEPRTGMVERCLVAAKVADIPTLLCMTKSDLADPVPFTNNFQHFDMKIIDAQNQIQELRDELKDKFSVLVGHSGVGKSTLINKLVPDADRQVGSVNNATGKGRHTSTSSVALALPSGGWVVDTPGVRSFGLGHASPADVLAVFPGLQEAAQTCLPLCTHLDDEPACALRDFPDQDLVGRARRLLNGIQR